LSRRARSPIRRRLLALAVDPETDPANAMLLASTRLRAAPD
jgi:hypothetical protein